MVQNKNNQPNGIEANGAEVSFLQAMGNHDDKDGVLEQEKLGEFIAQEKSKLSGYWDEFMEATPDSAEEELKATKLAKTYLAMTSEKLRDGDNDEIWMQRFNEAAGELFGGIDPDLAGSAFAKSWREIAPFAEESDADGAEFVVEIYEHVLQQQPGEFIELGTEIIGKKDIFNEILDRYRPVFDLIRSLGQGPYQSAETRSVFEKIIGQLPGEDWVQWKVTNPKNKGHLSVSSIRREIEVPDGKATINSKLELLGLALHEIGVHASRSVNGYDSGDQKLARGLPAYSNFEEGLGIFMELVVCDRLPDRVADRYMDTALATGAIRGIQLDREELKKFATYREILRSKARGVRPDKELISQMVTTHVNRLFRGTNGNALKDSEGRIKDQAVFLRDKLYLESVLTVIDYINEAISAGRKPKDVMDFLLSGKFDPTNFKHLMYMGVGE